MRLIQLLAKLLAPRLGVFAEERQGALKLTGGMQLDIDIILL